MKFTFLVPLLFLFLNCTDKNTSSRPLIQYVPENAFVIIKIKNQDALKNTIENNDFLSALTTSKTYKTIHEKVGYLKYLSPKSESILALTETSDNHFEFVYITENTADLINLDSVQNKAMESIEFAGSTFDKYTVENIPFYSLVTNQKVVVSSSKLLLEKLNGNFTAQQPETLKKLFTTANTNKAASIFLNLNNSNSLLSTITQENSKLQVSGFSDWISLDVNDNPKNLNLSGVSIANDSTWNYVDLFANTKPIANRTTSFAPSQADGILSYTFDDYAAFAKNRELSSGIVSPVDPPMYAVEEIGLIYLQGEKAIVLNTNGTEEISEYLISQKKKAFEYQGKEILELNKSDFLNNRFSPIVKNYKANFCVFLKNAFIFSSSQELKNQASYLLPIQKILKKSLMKIFLQIFQMI